MGVNIMNFLSPFARQVVVASSPQLAALSVGGLNAYPSVLLNQLQRNDSSIPLDLDSASWVASIQGLAGIPSLLIPTLMQWKGRRFAFITACFSILVGWTLSYFATSITIILLGECFHGFGGRSLNAVGLITISEMLDPKFRSISMVLFGIIEMMGLVTTIFAGYFFNCKTVSFIMALPVSFALVLVILWPESPSWLAYKGQFDKCELAFIMLRGTGTDATKELMELLRAQKESRQQNSLQKSLNDSVLKDVCFQLWRRDLLAPIIYVILIMFTFYFSGPLVIFTYSVEIISKTTNNSDSVCFLYIGFINFVGLLIGMILLKYFENKSILIVSFLGSGVFLVLSSIVIFCKDFDVVPKESLLICVLGSLFFCAFGSCYLTFNVSAELIPVKHRGLGGALYIVIACLFHSGALKISPYLFQSLDVSGTFLIFAFVSFLGALLIWKFVPETKGKTLQEIEDNYNVMRIETELKDDIMFEMDVVNDDIFDK